MLFLWSGPQGFNCWISFAPVLSCMYFESLSFPYLLFVPRLFEEKRGDMVSDIPSVLPFPPPLQEIGIVCMELLQFYSDSSETLQVFKSWSENVHIAGT